MIIMILSREVFLALAYSPWILFLSANISSIDYNKKNQFLLLHEIENSNPANQNHRKVDKRKLFKFGPSKSEFVRVCEKYFRKDLLSQI